MSEHLEPYNPLEAEVRRASGLVLQRHTDQTLDSDLVPRITDEIIREAQIGLGGVNAFRKLLGLSIDAAYTRLTKAQLPQVPVEGQSSKVYMLKDLKRLARNYKNARR